MTTPTEMSELDALRARLKQGEYDGADIMAAWIAIDELQSLRARLEDALASAHAAGRREGLEEAAKTANPLTNAVRIRALIDSPTTK